MGAIVGSRKGSVTRWLGVAVVVAVLSGGCGSDGEAATDSTTTSTAASTTSGAPSSTTEPSTTNEPSTSESTSTTEPATTAPDVSTSPTTLPGEPFDLFADEGDVLGVVGVRYDDVLNIRRAPGTDQDVIATATPLADDLVATGRERMLPGSIWYEVTTGDGVTGWASASFLAFLGRVDDATAEWQADNTLGEVETMVEMGEAVAATFASDEPPSAIVRSDAGGVGDLGDITYDVIGLGDDSVLGFRLHVFGTPSESGEGFVLKSIERTLLCQRGVSDELCV